MNFFISNAWAQDAAAAAPPGAPPLLFEILPLVLFLAVFYFILIRPQHKRTKEHKRMLTELSKGDEVVTNGGLLGKINEVGDNFVRLEIAEGLEVKVRKQEISSNMPKGTLAKTL